jgi:hypothetical protein
VRFDKGSRNGQTETSATARVELGEAIENGLSVFYGDTRAFVSD